MHGKPTERLFFSHKVAFSDNSVKFPGKFQLLSYWRRVPLGQLAHQLAEEFGGSDHTLGAFLHNIIAIFFAWRFETAVSKMKDRLEQLKAVSLCGKCKKKCLHPENTVYNISRLNPYKIEYNFRIMRNITGFIRQNMTHYMLIICSERHHFLRRWHNGCKTAGYWMP